MVYTFVQQENPVFCFISRKKILPICLEPETKFSREFQHKSYLNPKLVIVTQTNSTEFYLNKTLFHLLLWVSLIWNFDILLTDINFLVLSIQFQLIVNIIFQSKRRIQYFCLTFVKTVIIMQKSKRARF